MPTKKKNTTLSKIVAEAKRIQLAHPNMKWTNAIKDASKHIKEGAKTVVAKKIGNVSSFNMKLVEKQYLENENNNAHSENVILLAKYFGTKKDLELANEIFAKHKKEGYLSDSNLKNRNKLSTKLWTKAKKRGFLNSNAIGSKRVSNSKKSVHQVKKTFAIGTTEKSTKYSMVICTKEEKKFGKRVPLKDSFDLRVSGGTLNINPEDSNNYWIPFTENGVLMYRSKVEKYTFDSGNEKGKNIRFLVPDNSNFNEYKNKVKMISKSFLY